MRSNRMMLILGLVVAIPMLLASMAFACEKTCSGKASAATASAAAASAKTANTKADCAAKCSSKAQAASAGASCSGKAQAATAGAGCSSHEAKHASCGDACAKACCAGKTAAVITYSVSGMTCMGCVKQVEKAVAKMDLENVESVSVSLDNNNAVVTTTGPVDAVAVAKAITEAGFQAEFAGAEHPESAQDDKKEEPAATM